MTWLTLTDAAILLAWLGGFISGAWSMFDCREKPGRNGEVEDQKP